MTNKYTGTHITGPRNSTEFTNCCGLAVIPQAGDKKCPGCGSVVTFLSRPRPTNCRMCGQPRSMCHC